MSGKQLEHGFEIPPGKQGKDIVAERHDMVLLFEAVKANPNGDPDTGNMPRLQPDTQKGLVTDVCLKRKVRNFFTLFKPNGDLRSENEKVPGYDIFVFEGAVLQDVMESPEVEKDAKEIFLGELKGTEKQWVGGKKKKKLKDEQEAGKAEKEAPGPSKEIAYRKALCRMYYDLRAFGGVISTEGPLKGSFYGQVRGPIQFTFAESLDKLLQLDATITRCAAASEKEKKPEEGSEADGSEAEGGSRTMGRKHLVDYGLYRSHIYLSPAFAARTEFTYADLDNFLFALTHVFDHDAAAGRAGLRVVGLVDFQHASSLGNEHAHKLFERVVVHRKPASEGEFPRSLRDYEGEAPSGAVPSSNGGGQSAIVARRIVWDIPAIENGQP